MIEPKNLCTVQVSPRQRAQRTFELLFEHTGILPEHVSNPGVQEWNYGKMDIITPLVIEVIQILERSGIYEGLKPAEIKQLNPTWKIWNDG